MHILYNVYIYVCVCVRARVLECFVSDTNMMEPSNLEIANREQNHMVCEHNWIGSTLGFRQLVEPSRLFVGWKTSH